jgi:Fic family protein
MGMDGRMEFLNMATLRITPEILSMIAEIDEFKGAWRAIGRIAPERLSSLRRVATIESVGSSTRIEGARLTDREVEKLLANIRLGSFTTRDEQEVAGYAEVMETIFSAYEAISFTENHIRQLHRDLLAHSTKDERHRGAYKTREKRLHPLLVVAIFVVVFLEIHPFQDGNGRLSRILTTMLLLRTGYAYVPYSSLESIIEQSKESYYISLRRTQGTIRSAEPDWNPWIEFFLRALHRQKTRLEKKMERERIILADMPELSVTLLELAREHGRITVAEAARITDASRHTIKDHLKALVDHGHLILHGAGRGAWYGLS